MAKQINLPGSATAVDNATANDDVAANESAALRLQVAQLTAQIAAGQTDSRIADDAAKAAEEVKAKKQLDMEANLKDLLGGPAPAQDDEESNSGNSGKGVNDMDNSQLLDLIAGAVDGAINAKITQATNDVAEQLKVSDGKLSQMMTMVGQMTAKASIADARSEHPDFEKYREDTLRVLAKYPAMDIKDAFYMAKGQKVGNTPAASELETERPTDTPYGSMAGASVPRVDPTNDLSYRSKRSQPVPVANANTSPAQGIQGFRGMLNAALDKVIV